MKIHKAWYVLIAMCGLIAASIGISINTSGVFYSVVASSLHLYRGSFAFHMTIFSMVTAITALFVPILLKKIHFKLLLTITVLLAVLGTAGMALASKTWQFNLLGALRGFATGIFSIVTVTMIINNWFIAKNGLATSLALAFSGIMGAIFSPIFAIIIEKTNWQFAYLVEAIVIFLLTLPAILIPYKLDPAEEKRAPYGQAEETATTVNPGSRKINTTALLLLIVFSAFVAYSSSMTQHLPGYAGSMNYSIELGANLLSLGMIGNIVSKLLVGVISDYMGIVKTTLLLITANILACILLIMGHPVVLPIIGSFLFGSSYGLGAVCCPLLTLKAFGKNNYGKTFPMMSFAGNLGASIAFSIIGYIYDFTSSYIPAIIVILLMLIATVLSVLFIGKISQNN